MTEEDYADTDNYLLLDLETRYALMSQEKAKAQRELLKVKEQMIKNTNAYKNQSQALRDELMNRQSQLDQQAQEIQLLKEEVRRQENTIDTLTNQNERVKRATEKLKLDNELMEQELSKLKNQRRIFYDRLEDVRLSMEQSTEKIKAKDKILLESQAEKRILEKSINDLKLQIEQLSTQVQVKSRKIKELQQCVQADLQNHLSQATNNARLISQLNQLQAIKTLHLERINELEQQRDEYKEKLTEYSRQLQFKNSEAREGGLECQTKMVEINSIMSNLSETIDKGKLMRQAKKKVSREVKNSLAYLERVISSYR